MQMVPKQLHKTPMTAESCFKELSTKLTDFVSKYRYKPQAVVVGANEYVFLNQYFLIKHGDKMLREFTLQPLYFQGIPILGRIGHGMDIIPPMDILAMFCMAPTEAPPEPLA
jgi:hypothetical protein